jgi:hypothetical protein
MTTRELKTVYDNRKSFYGRAYTTTDDNGNEYLTSYKTTVCKIVDGKFIRLWDSWSSTTSRHINEFRQQNGLPKITKSEWDKMEVADK